MKPQGPIRVPLVWAVLCSCLSQHKAWESFILFTYANYMGCRVEEILKFHQSSPLFTHSHWSINSHLPLTSLATTFFISSSKSFPIYSLFPCSACHILLYLISTFWAPSNCLPPSSSPLNFSVSHWKRKKGLKGDLGMINRFLLLHPSPFYSKGSGDWDLYRGLETNLQQQARDTRVRFAHITKAISLLTSPHWTIYYGTM